MTTSTYVKKILIATAGAVLSWATMEINPLPSKAAVFFGNDKLSGGFRWDAAPRIINGNERSLDGGLRYSLQGGSYQAYRDLFTWDVVPSVSEFQNAIESAFNAWTLIDPESGLGTDLFFVADLETEVVGTGRGGVNTAGAEIDLLAAIDGTFWNPGNSGQQAEAFFQARRGDVTLTSGTAGYSGGGAISGADITFNNNPSAVYSLNIFQLVLTHEIGHTIGFGDVEFNINPGVFIDDNFDGSSSKTALATLTNSWAHLVNPFNPAASPLFLFDVPNADPGIDTFGVDILMESLIPSALIGDPNPLRNDDYGGRQFLYPFVQAASVPEPTSTLGLVVIVGLGVQSRLLKKRKEY